MKKMLCVGLCFLLALSLVACENSQEQSVEEPSDEITISTPAQVPDTQFPPMEEVAPDVSTEGEHILIAYFSMIDVVPEDADASTHATPAK